jgi:hypothetical protein
LSVINSVTLVSGTTYLVRVSTYSSNYTPGAFTLTVSNTAAPGACCATNGTCSAVANAAACTGSNTFISGGVCSPNPCPQPLGNDECAAALAATGAPFAYTGTGFSFTGTTSNATNSSGVSLATCQLTTGTSTNPTTGKDIYFKFTPSVDNNYNITLCASTPVWDSVLSVHTGCPASAANQVFCNDDGVCLGGVGLSAILNQPLTAGTPYIIRVAGYQGTSATAASGNVNLQVSSDPLGTCCSPDGSSCTLVLGSACSSPNTFSAGATCSANPCPIPAPANDDCSTAVLIASVPYTSPAPIQIGGAQPDQDISCNSGTASGLNNGVWFTYTPSSNCSLSVARTATGGTTDTAAAVFSGTCGGLTEVACADAETINFNLTGGTQYYILIGAYSGTAITASTTLSISADCVAPPPPPANDTCAGAVAVTSVPFTSGNIAAGGATPDANLSCNSGGASAVNNGIWFSYTAASNCGLSVSETGSLNAIVGIYSGACGSLSEVSCSVADTAPTFVASAGTTYYILVGVEGLGAAGATDNLAVSIDCVLPPSNDDCSGALVVSSSPYTSPTINMFAATPDIDVSCNSSSASVTNNGVWFTYTPTANGTLALNNTTGPDTITTVFTGSCGSLSEVTCSDPAGFNVQVTAGTQYYILVGYYYSTPITTNPTNLVFTLNLIVAAANDDCSTATVIPGDGYTDSYFPAAATADIDVSCNSTSATALNNSAWYTYTPTSNSLATFAETGGNDTIVAAFTGSCGSLTEIACTDSPESLSLTLTAGTPYYFVTGIWSSTASTSTSTAISVSFSVGAIPAAPANDNCSSATLITSLPYTSGNIPNAGANADANGSCNSSGTTQVNNGVWFTYTPTSNCNFFLSETTAQDAVMVVFIGDCSFPLEAYCTASDSDVGTFAASAGTQYFILVGRQGTTSAGLGDNINFSLDCQVPPSAAPANDTCNSATVITSVPFDSGSVFASLATDDADISCNADGSTVANHGVWFTYTPSGPCLLSLAETGPLDTAITVFTGSCGSLTETNCSDPESFSFTANPGTQYYIMVSRWSTTALATFDSYRLTASCLVPAANDTCASAINLNGNLPYAFSTDTTTATNDGPNPPEGSCDEFFIDPDEGVDNSIFYTFTPASNGVFNLVGLTTNYDPIFLVYTGSCGALTEVFCDSAAASASFNMTAGTTYTIVIGDEGTIDGGGTNTGSFTFVSSVSNFTCCRGTTCTLTAPGGCTAPAGVGVSTPVGQTSCNASGNNTAPCCYSDFNKDGSRNIDDIFIYLNAWFGTASNPYTKIGGDGVANANIDDLFVFINVWFAGGCG